MKASIKIFSFVMITFLSNYIYADPIDNLHKDFPDLHGDYGLVFDKVVLSLVKGSIDFNNKSSDAILSFLSKRQLRILRNAMFAKYGKTFKNDDLKEYFNKTRWYKPGNNKIQINEQEKSIIKKILSYENSAHINVTDVTNLFPKINLPLTIASEADDTAHKKYHFNAEIIYSRAAMRKAFNLDSDILFFKIIPQAKFRLNNGNAYIIKFAQRMTDSVSYYIYTLNDDGHTIQEVKLCSSGGAIHDWDSCVIHVDMAPNIYVIEKNNKEDNDGVHENIIFQSYHINKEGTIVNTSNK